MPSKVDFKEVQSTLWGGEGSSNKTWDDFVIAQINNFSKKYSGSKTTNNILARWLQSVTLGYKHDKNFSPHINGFYMIFMVHGTWYDMYKTYVDGDNKAGLSPKPDGKAFREDVDTLNLENPYSYMSMLATDIEVPDITEEYTSVSSRIRNSFVPSRNYFVSDFSISYIENNNLDIIRYHDAWHKFLNLVRRGEVDIPKDQCRSDPGDYFIDVPFSNAVWIAVFRPFSTEIQLLIKLVGVMPVSLPLKQVIGNRSASKMTVLNLSYKAADIFYKFYNNTEEIESDNGALATAFRHEILENAAAGNSTITAPDYSSLTSGTYFGGTNFNSSQSGNETRI